MRVLEVLAALAASLAVAAGLRASLRPALGARRGGSSDSGSGSGSRLWEQPEKYIAPALERRLKDGLLTAGDLERMFGLGVRQTERVLQETSRPFDIGVVVSLESVLVDMTIPAGYAFAALSSEVGQSTPNPLRVKEATGLTFKESVAALGWDALPASVLPKAEARYYEILEQFMASDLFPTTLREGAAELLHRLLEAPYVSLCVSTSLRRQTAIAGLSKTGLSGVLEGRLAGARLIHPDSEQWADRLEGQQLLRACGEMRRAPMVCVSIDACPKRLLQAKRVGLCTAGVRQGCSTPVLLRHCDRIFDAAPAISLKEILTILRKNVELSNGMKQQAQAADVRIPTNTVKLVAPAMEDDNRARPDTFAEEFKSDIL